MSVRNDARKKKAIVTTAADQLALPGKETLEETIRRYDRSLVEMNEYVETQCKSELEAVTKAQADLEEKLRQVMSQDKMKAMEATAEDHGDQVNVQMRRMQRQLRAMEDDIYDDQTIDTKTRDEQLHALHKTALSEYGKLSEKYPAAMRVQLLSQVRCLR